MFNRLLLTAVLALAGSSALAQTLTASARSIDTSSALVAPAPARQILTNGTTIETTFHSNGQKATYTTYRNGLKHGTALRYAENGQLQTQETYSAGLLTDGTFYYPNGAELHYTDLNADPSFPGGVAALRSFVQENLRQRNGRSARTTARFFIEPDGAITGVQLDGTATDLNADVMRLLKAMPRWQPAFRDGQPVRAHYVLPIGVE